MEYAECPQTCQLTCKDIKEEEELAADYDLSIFARSYGMTDDHATYQSESSCEPETETCLCPGQTVLRSNAGSQGVPANECVDEVNCWSCFDAVFGIEREIGEAWMKDNCTTCSCEEGLGKKSQSAMIVIFLCMIFYLMKLKKALLISALWGKN